MPTCALKSPKRTWDSDEVAFPNATSTSSRKTSYCGSMLGAYTCKITHQMAEWYGASASGSVDLEFNFESGQTNDFKIGIHSFPA